MAEEKESLREGLLIDVARAETKRQQQAKALGTKAREGGEFGIKSIRIQGQAINKADLLQSQSAINKTVTSLVREANFVDKLESNKLTLQLQQRFAKMKKLLAEKAAEAQIQAARQGLDSAQRARLAQAFSATAQLAAAQAVGNMGGGTLEGSKELDIFSGESAQTLQTSGGAPGTLQA